MKDWLSKRNLGDDDASGMERDGTDVIQNVAEIVGSFSLEKVEEQQPSSSKCWRTKL